MKFKEQIAKKKKIFSHNYILIFILYGRFANINKNYSLPPSRLVRVELKAINQISTTNIKFQPKYNKYNIKRCTISFTIAYIVFLNEVLIKLE